MALRLESCIVLVTGAAGTLGSAISTAIAAEGGLVAPRSLMPEHRDEQQQAAMKGGGGESGPRRPSDDESSLGALAMV